MDKPSAGKGVFFAVFAYLIWGILPLYWKVLSGVDSLHILGFRIIFSLLLVSVILFSHKNFLWFKFYKDRRKGILLTLAGLMITVNWGLYIWAVNSGHTIDTSLGYYINPLLSIVLGLCVFREKLKLLQVIAFGLACVGVLILTVLTGRLPWVSLGLAFTFAIYGLLKKTISISGLESLGVETLVASPIGFILFLIPFEASASFPDPASLSYILKLPLTALLLIMLCGVVTTLPLYLFAEGAKKLPLSTLGFIQFLSPTLSFLTGFFIFGEYFPPRNFVAFGFIWTAVILYIISLKFGNEKKHPIY